MKHLRPLLIVPLFAAAAVLVGIFNLSSLASLREQSPQILMAFWSLWDLAWAWLLTPPLWATITALCIMTVAYVASLLPLDQWLSILSFLYCGDYRTAQFKKIVDDEGISALKKSVLAKRVLKQISWEPFPPPPLPPFTSSDEAITAMSSDQWYIYADRLWAFFPRTKFLDILMMARLDQFDIDQKFLNRINQAISNAGKRAYDNRASWEKYERGRYFPNDESRNRWHEWRVETDEANRLLPELKSALETQAKAWERAIDADTRTQLLEDIGDEMFP
jgi:hypothetical protein